MKTKQQIMDELEVALAIGRCPYCYSKIKDIDGLIPTECPYCDWIISQYEIDFLDDPPG